VRIDRADTRGGSARDRAIARLRDGQEPMTVARRPVTSAAVAAITVAAAAPAASANSVTN
jgi:hypothetical protein